MRGLRVGLPGLILLYSMLQSPFWDRLGGLFRQESYELRRTTEAFDGLPVDAIRDALDARLSPGQPLALSSSLQEDAFLRQRLSEGLYPRIIDSRSTVTLDLAPPDADPDPRQVPLAGFKNGTAFVLRGAPIGDAPAPPRLTDAVKMPLSTAGFLTSLLSVYGLGVLLRGLFRRRLDDPALWIRIPYELLAGALALGLLLTASTLAQIAFPWWLARATGLAGVALDAAVAVRRAPLRPRTQALGPVPLILAGLFLLYLMLVAASPVSLWDGRSIWLFRAHQLSHHGMFALADMLHPDSEWSHPDYPLLFPAWLAFFGGTPFSERSASLGIPVLFLALLTLMWHLMTTRAGRIAAAALPLVFFFTLEEITAGGYSDGFLAALLVVEFLALSTAAERDIGWIAAAAASLFKLEGLVLAAVVALVAHSGPVHAGHALKRRMASLLTAGIVFLPAAVYSVWGRSVGLRGTFPSLNPIQDFSDLLQRSAVCLQETWRVMQHPFTSGVGAFLWGGAAAALLALLAIRFCGSPFTRWTALAAVLILIFPFVVMLVTPYGVEWHVRSAMDRLLLHPAAFFLLLFFALCDPPVASAPSAEDRSGVPADA